MDFAKTPSTAVSKPIKALLCVLLSLVLVLGFVPVSPAYADATENPAEQGDNANSFRYSDGQLSDEVTTLSESSSWTSSYGDAAYKGASGKKVKVPASHAVGIDVSHHNGTINWVKVRNQGIDFAIIRIGYGSNKKAQDDRQYANNVKGATKAGVPFGVYIYSYAKSVKSAKSEADHVIRQLKAQGITPGKLALPVYYDVEDITQQGLGQKKMGEICTAFCNKIRAAGYPVGIYSSYNWWSVRYPKAFTNSHWSKWVARVNNDRTTSGISGTDIWQFTFNGSVAGAKTNKGVVDMNFLFDENLAQRLSLPYKVGNYTVSAYSYPSSVSYGSNFALAMVAELAGGKMIDEMKVQILDSKGNVLYEGAKQFYGEEQVPVDPEEPGDGDVATLSDEDADGGNAGATTDEGADGSVALLSDEATDEDADEAIAEADDADAIELLGEGESTAPDGDAVEFASDETDERASGEQAADDKVVLTGEDDPADPVEPTYQTVKVPSTTSKFSIKGTSLASAMKFSKLGVGSYRLLITATDDTGATATLANKSFKVVPKKVGWKGLKGSKKAFTAKWTALGSAQASGYQIMFSKRSSLKGGKTITVKGGTKGSKKLTGKKAKKRYYVKVRAYKVVNGVTYYGAWSSVKKVKTK